jgi:hypothetical protein
MNDLSLYYSKIITSIKEKCKNGNLSDALEILDQELQSPYIPSQYLTELENLYININQKALVEQIVNKYKNMSKMEMLSQILIDSKININVLSFFLSKFNKQIDLIDLQYLNKIFLNKNISNSDKLFVLEQLKMCDIKYEFNFYNNYLNKEFKINSEQFYSLDNSEYYQLVKSNINNILIKNPSILNLAQTILLSFYETYFPINMDYKTEVLATNICRYVESQFDTNIECDKNFISLLNKILIAKN